MSKTERQKYKIVGPATWELIRAAYLGGASAPALAERFGVTEHAIRKRIKVEGWSKRDYAKALELRGAIRDQEKQNFIEESGLREQMRRVRVPSAGVEQRDDELNALVERIAAEGEAADIAGELERRALAEASAAILQGRSKEAQALALMAERMRKYGGATAQQAPAQPPMTPPPAEAAPLYIEREPTPGASLEEMEQQALKRAGEAIAEGRANDAKVLTGLADQLRKRIGEAQAVDEEAAFQAKYKAEALEAAAMALFARAAALACMMIHTPAYTPVGFILMVKRWREINLGEGEKDAEERARKALAASKHFFDGTWENNLPEDVRIHVDQHWLEMRERMHTRIQSETMSRASASGSETC